MSVHVGGSMGGWVCVFHVPNIPFHLHFDVTYLLHAYTSTLYWYCGQIQWISSFSISSIEFDAASKLLFWIVFFLLSFFPFLSSIPSLILPHCSLFFIKTVYICACVWYDDGQQAENKKEESESHAHTNRIEFKNDNIIIRKGAPKYWIDWKTLSSPLLSASATPHMIHTRSTHIGQWCNTRSIIYLSGWCFECSTFIHHKKSFVLSMSICKPSVTTSINIHHQNQNHHHHCRHHNQSINNNNNNKKEKYNWIVLLAPFKFCAFAFAWRKILFLSFSNNWCYHIYFFPHYPMDYISFAQQTWNVTFTIQISRLGLSNQIKSNQTNDTRFHPNQLIVLKQNGSKIVTPMDDSLCATRSKWKSLIIFFHLQILYHIILYKSLPKHIAHGIRAWASCNACNEAKFDFLFVIFRRKCNRMSYPSFCSSCNAFGVNEFKSVNFVLGTYTYT